MQTVSSSSSRPSRSDGDTPRRIGNDETSMPDSPASARARRNRDAADESGSTSHGRARRVANGSMTTPPPIVAGAEHDGLVEDDASELSLPGREHTIRCDDARADVGGADVEANGGPRPQ